MITKILKNQEILKNLYYNQLDKLRETFDFNDQEKTFNEMENIATNLNKEITKHFELQEQLKNQINPKIDKLILENMLVKDILVRMSNKIIDGAQKKDINIFSFFDDFEEILKAYLKKEKGLFIQEIKNNTTPQEQEKIKEILN